MSNETTRQQYSVTTASNILREEATKTDSEALWPERSVRAVADAGLLGLTVPKQLGGTGAGMREFVDVTRELSKSCASTGMIYLMHVCGTQVIASAGQSKALDRIISGKAIATLAFSEKGSRSHFWAPVSRAVQNGTGVKINAEKSFVTSAGHADYYVVSSGAVDGKTVMDSTLYLVANDNPGVEVSGNWTGLGLRGNSSAPMTFRCHVDSSVRLTEELAGFPAMMQIVLPWFQVGSAAVSIGIAEAALDDAIRHTSSARLEHLGETLAASVPSVRARLARMSLLLESTKGYVSQALGKLETQAADAMLGVLGVKAVASEAAIDITDEAMRACGGAAFGRQLSIDRNFRDARAASIMAPTTDVLYDFLGKALAGLPLF